ncbi:MAG: hypothetical protein H5U02_00190 [Clostridia bacterium]|nr:hypothetical protein [Clostridia bacterium]
MMRFNCRRENTPAETARTLVCAGCWQDRPECPGRTPACEFRFKELQRAGWKVRSRDVVAHAGASARGHWATFRVVIVTITSPDGEEYTFHIYPR